MRKSPTPAPKLDSTRTAPPPLASSNEDKHDEALIDESIDESFPASDPPAVAQPGSTLSRKKRAKKR
jgi:hypothetical protein